MNYGKDYGRLVVIVDVIDQNRVMFLSMKKLTTIEESIIVCIYCFFLLPSN